VNMFLMVIHEPPIAKARSSSFTERVAAISARRSHWPPSCAAQAGCSPVAAINGDECGVDVCSVSSCPSQCNSSEETPHHAGVSALKGNRTRARRCVEE